MRLLQKVDGNLLQALHTSDNEQGLDADGAQAAQHATFWKHAVQCCVCLLKAGELFETSGAADDALLVLKQAGKLVSCC